MLTAHAQDKYPKPGCCSAPAVCDVVDTLTFTVAGADESTCTLAGTEQVAAAGAPAQVSITVPAKPAEGMRLRV
jgi:hypothetical protein